MKHYQLFISCFLLAVIIFNNSCNWFCETASGNLITESRDVADFTAIEMDGSGIIYISKGEKSSIEITTDDNVMTVLETEVSREELKLKLNGCIENITRLEVRITVPKLTGVVVTGSVKVVSNELFTVDELVIRSSGSGEIKLKVDAQELITKINSSGNVILSGKADNHEVTIKGAGNLNALELKTNELDADISASGKAEVFVLKNLKADISDSGQLKYKGNPQKINTNATDAGTVSNVE